MKSFLEILAYFFHLTGGRTPRVKMKNMGQAILPMNPTGLPSVGKVSQLEMDESGVHMMEMSVGSIAGCGHWINDQSRIAGICSHCGRLCCILPGCLAVCSLEGVTACRQHYTVWRGYPVSKRAQRKGLWKSKVKALKRNRGSLDETYTPRKALPPARKRKRS